MKKFKTIYKKIYFKIILLIRQFKGRFFYITLEKKIPKIHVNDKYEKDIKLILRIITFIGVLSSVFAFPVWYLNLVLAIFLILLEQFLEKAVFMYYAFYISAIPEYKSEDWKGMVWVNSINPSENYFEIGIFFSNREAATRIFSTIKHWSKNGYDDKDNMVQVSIIINKSDYYHVYIYPNVDLDPDYISFKEKMNKEKPNKENHTDFMSIMLCKGFDYSTSTFPRFQEAYKNGENYYLYAYVLENNKPVKLSGLGYIKKNVLKIKNEDELTQKDREYEHSRYIIDCDKYKEEQLEASRSYIGLKK